MKGILSLILCAELALASPAVCRKTSTAAMGIPEENAVLDQANLEISPGASEVGNLEALGRWQAKLDAFIAANRGKPEFSRLVEDFIVSISSNPPGGALPGDVSGIVRPIGDWHEFFRQEPFRYLRLHDGKWYATPVLEEGGPPQIVLVEQLRDCPLYDNVLNTLRNEYLLWTDVRKLATSEHVERARSNYLRQALFKEAYLLWRERVPLDPGAPSNLFKGRVRGQ